MGSDKRIYWEKRRRQNVKSIILRILNNANENQDFYSGVKFAEKQTFNAMTKILQYRSCIKFPFAPQIMKVG